MIFNRNGHIFCFSRTITKFSCISPLSRFYTSCLFCYFTSCIYCFFINRFISFIVINSLIIYFSKYSIRKFSISWNIPFSFNRFLNQHLTAYFTHLSLISICRSCSFNFNIFSTPIMITCFNFPTAITLSFAIYPVSKVVSQRIYFKRTCCLNIFTTKISFIPYFSFFCTSCFYFYFLCLYYSSFFFVFIFFIFCACTIIT